MTTENSNNLAYGLAIASGAQAEADNANQRALDAESRAMEAELRAARKTTNSDLERRLVETQLYLSVAESRSMAMEQLLKEKDTLINEWMHSNEAFKRLARSYGKKLNMSDDERSDDFQNQLVDLSKENPQFSNTSMVERAIKILSEKGNSIKKD